MADKAMYKLSYGLYVLTAKEDGKDNGCIINTAVQVTSSPERISITVNKMNKTHDMIVNTGVFNISTISMSTDFTLFERFGFHSGKDTDKFSGFSNRKQSANGLMYITDYANSFISAKVFETIDLGTHTMFIADVTESEVLSSDKSVTYEYYLSNIKPQPKKAETVKGYQCTVCGYIYEGDTLPDDFVCPLCKHPASDFEKITE